MLKVADALAGAGYNVRVVSANFVRWASDLDRDVRLTREWPWTVINYECQSAPMTYLLTGIRYHSCKWISQLRRTRISLHLTNRAHSRIHSELVRAVLAQPADLVYAGTRMALGAAAEAADQMRIPYALDLEDFHTAEQYSSLNGGIADRLVERIERTVLPQARFVTAASDAISAAYFQKYGIRPITLNNTFALPSTPVNNEPSPTEGLRLYWFSQTIGPGRGLEDSIRAVSLARITAQLHLRGCALPGYVEQLRNLASQCGARLELVQHRPVSPDSMVDGCRGYDVGLALEQGDNFNREICLTNKAFTYILAGLAVAFTDTSCQHDLAVNLGEGALLYRQGDVAALAIGLKRWAEDKSQLARAKLAAWRAAQHRWHWEHPKERGALLAAVASIFALQYADCRYS